MISRWITPVQYLYRVLYTYSSWNAFNGVIAAIALCLSVRNDRLLRRLAKARWKCQATINLEEVNGKPMKCLSIQFINVGAISLIVNELGLQIPGKPALLQCKWPKNRSELPCTLVQGQQAFARYYEDEFPALPAAHAARLALVVLADGRHIKFGRFAVRKWGKLGQPRGAPLS
jgi:hypothetical protein